MPSHHSTLFSPAEPVVQGEAILFSGKHKDEEQQSKPRYHVGVELIERLLEQMPESDQQKDGPEGNQGRANPQPEEEKASRDELHDGHGGACRPE